MLLRCLLGETGKTTIKINHLPMSLGLETTFLAVQTGGGERKMEDVFWWSQLRSGGSGCAPQGKSGVVLSLQ